jgi:hypothetical protein
VTSPITAPAALEPLVGATGGAVPAAPASSSAPAAAPAWSVAAVPTTLSPADKRRALVRARLEAWQAADGAARNAERRVDEDTRASLLAGGPGPSSDLMRAAIKLRSIALERLERLRDALATG